MNDQKVLVATLESVKMENIERLIATCYAATDNAGIFVCYDLISKRWQSYGNKSDRSRR